MSVTVIVTDSLAQTASQSISITIYSKPTLNCTAGAAGVVGTPYSSTPCTGSGGVTPYSYTASGLPPGLSINAGTGAITGTPTTAGVYNNVVVIVTDSLAQTASQTISITIYSKPTLNCTAGAAGVVGTPYSSTPCTASGAVTPYSYTATGLPPGLLINAGTGAITGTPTTAGTYNSVTVIVTDSLAQTASQTISITIYSKPTLNCTAGAAGVVGTPYSSTPCTASGGVTPYYYTASGLPPGLSINAGTGAIAGTPTAAGVYNSVIVIVTDSLAQTASQTISITIYSKPTLNCTAGAAGVVGTPYSSTPCTASGGVTPYSYTASGLPPGLSINAGTGAITGTPTTAGVYNNVVVIVTDSLAQTASQTISITIYSKPTLNCTAGAAGIVGTPYSSTPCTAGGGDPPYSYSATGLPPGLSMNAATGAITGTPTNPAVYPVTVTVTDSTTPTSQTVSQQVTIP